jgi:hypothetical protein
MVTSADDEKGRNPFRITPLGLQSASVKDYLN